MKKNYLKFLVAFTASLLVMCLPWGLSFYLINCETAVQPLEKIAISEANTAVLLKIEGDSKAFLKMDISGNNISLSVLPPEILGEDCGKFKTLLSIWESDGGKYAAAALNKTYSLNIEKWAVLNSGDFTRICDMLGCCDFNVAEDVKDENGFTLISHGRKIISGTDMLLMLSKGKGEDFLLPYSRFGEALTALLNSGQNIFNNGEEVEIFNLLANSSDNNLGIYDLTKLQNSAFFSEPLIVTCKAVSGSLSGDKKLFLPT